MASNSAAVVSAVRDEQVVRASTVILRIVPLALGLLFFVSGFMHLLNPYYFLRSVLDYNLVSPNAAVAIVVCLPMLQLTVSFCLFARICLPGALLVAMCLSAMFGVTQTAVLLEGRDISCGCFGTFSSAIGVKSMSLAFGMAAFAAVALVATHVGKKEER